MRSKDSSKIRAFIDYAMDTEGMKFCLCKHGDAFVAIPCAGTRYAPEVIHAVKRNFNEEWKMAMGGRD